MNTVKAGTKDGLSEAGKINESPKDLAMDSKGKDQKPMGTDKKPAGKGTEFC